MSKTFTKTLVICAMVVLFPLMIVGTAFASYYSIDATVNVAAYAIGDSQSDAAYAKVAYGSTSETTMEITESHLKKIDLNAVSNGYNFEGWFNADATSYEVANAAGKLDEIKVSDNTNLSVQMTDYTQLLAVFSIKKYTVGYSYKETPDGPIISTTPETDDGDAVSRAYTYGDALPVLPYTGVDYRFMGWRVVGEAESVAPHTMVDFDNEDVTLTAVWEAQNQITITYYKENGTEIFYTVKKYENESFTLDDALTTVGTAAVDGYSYAWRDADGNTISEVRNQTRNLDVYLKSTPITYSAKLNCGDVKFDGQSTSIINFTVRSLEALNDWGTESKWNTTYSFYKVKGVQFNGIVYGFENTATFEDLARAIVAANPRGSETAVEITTNVEKHFTNFAVSGNIELKAGSSNVYLDKNDIPDSEYQQPARKNRNSTDTINALLGLELDNGATRPLYNENGEAVTLRSIEIWINGVSRIYTVSNSQIDGSMTLNELIEIMWQNNQRMDLAETFTVEKIQVNFAK